MTDTVVDRSSRREITMLLYALAGGVVWWFIHLLGGIVIGPISCDRHLTWVNNVSTVVCGVGAASALLVSFAVRRAGTAVAVISHRNEVLGFLAIIFNVASIVLILLEGVPNLVLSPCL